MRWVIAWAAAAAVVLAAAGCGGDDGGSEQLTIGYLGDSTGGLGEFGPQIQQGVDLAIEQINEAGGVNGQPVRLVAVDTGTDPELAVREARRLVAEEGVQAFVGPLGTEPAIAVAEQVSRELGIPTITPSATSPALSDLDDGGYLFRTTISDAAQGPILAQLVAADLQVYDVGVLYEDSAYGRGLLEAFERRYPGTLTSVAYEKGQPSYLDELREAASGGAGYLVAIGYPAEASVYVREAVEAGLFDSFVFVDGTRSLDLIRELGPELLEGSKGTAQAAGPSTAATEAFDAAFVEQNGALPATPFVREAYDAVAVIALAAEAADRLDGPSLRTALVEVANRPGVAVTPGVASLRLGLEAARDGEAIDYHGAASSLDWDEHGDLSTGFVGIWEYTGGTVVDLEAIPFDLR